MVDGGCDSACDHDKLKLNFTLRILKVEKLIA